MDEISFVVILFLGYSIRKAMTKRMGVTIPNTNAGEKMVLIDGCDKKKMC